MAQEALKIHINPNNRQVSIKDPHYQQAWIAAFEETRAEIEEEIKSKLAAGELELAVDPEDLQVNTQDRAIRFMAHSNAEIAMQSWAVKRGIGMVGVNAGLDQGTIIEYVDDPSVAFLEYKVEQAA